MGNPQSAIVFLEAISPLKEVSCYSNLLRPAFRINGKGSAMVHGFGMRPSAHPVTSQRTESVS
jgi:hypothetical protein